MSWTGLASEMSGGGLSWYCKHIHPLCFRRDKACKEFDPEFKVELFLDIVPDIPGEFAALKSEYLEADNDDDMDDD